MPGILNGCRSGANFDSLPRGQRGSHAAIHKLNLQRQNDDLASVSSRPSSPHTVDPSSRPLSPPKGPRMKPVENLAANAAKVERSRSSPFPQSAPNSPRANHPHAHSQHGAGAQSRARHRLVDKRQIGLPTNFQHTGHIGRASYSAATSAMETAAIQAQLSQVAAALSMDINLDLPAEEQVQSDTADSSEAIESISPPQNPTSIPSSPEMIPLPLSEPGSPLKRASMALSGTSSPRKESKAPPTPPSTSHGSAEAGIRAVPQHAARALPSPPIAFAALPSVSPSRHGATPSTVSPASQIAITRPLSPRTAGPAQGQALRRKPVPRSVDFVELTPEEREERAKAREELEAQAVALQRRASSASAAKKLESLTKDMMGGLASDAAEAGDIGVVPEEPEGDKPVAPAPAQGGLLVPGGPTPGPSIGSQLLAPRFLPPTNEEGAGESDSSSGLPRGTVRINGKAFVEGPSGSLITRTANTRWNSALAEITAALASEGADGNENGLPPKMMSKEEEEALMLRMGIPLGPSDRSNQLRGEAGPSETVRLKVELADAAHALTAFEGEGEGEGAARDS
ncbi:unnamed protein product [Tilletia controversa]|nr:unnamed protein product [Tilletia controversa]